MMDMHFFQHFLLQSHPLYPLGNETVWKHEVLCLAQQVSLMPLFPAAAAVQGKSN